MPPAFEVLLLNTAVPQIQAAQSGDTYVVPRDIAFSAALTLSAGTANGVPYLNASKVLTTGSALTFDGTTLTATTQMAAGTTGTAGKYLLNRASDGAAAVSLGLSTNDFLANNGAGGGYIFNISNAEQMRLTTTGLGIGTSSPAVYTANSRLLQIDGGANAAEFKLTNSTTGSAGADGTLFQLNGSAFYLWNLENSFLSFGTNNGEKMRLDSSGNLGLGVTPSAWATNWNALQVGQGNTALVGRSDAFALYLGQNWRYDGTDKYIGSAAASVYSQNGGAHAWFNAPSGTANSASVTSGASYTVVALGSSTLAQWQAFFNDSSNNPLTVTPTLGQVLTGNATGTLLGGGLVTQNISFTQAMTLDASGNLGVGATSPGARLHASQTSGGGSVVGAYLQNPDNNTNTEVRLAFGPNDAALASNRYAWVGAINTGSVNATALTFATGPGGTSATERARITSGGDLLVGRTSVPVTNTAGAAIQSTGLIITESSQSQGGLWVNRISSDGTAIQFTRDNVVVGSVSVTTTATAYNTSSDYRLKNITGPITTSGAYIDSLNPVEGTWKADGSTFVGLIAHEVQEASRTTVATGEKDGEQMQGMDYSNAELIANLIAEVKSLRARVAQLEQGA